MTHPGHRPDPDHDAVCASSARHRVVVAPPGTGKTHLAVRLAGTLAATLPNPPVPESTIGARVLLLTFSNQARSQLEAEACRQLTFAQRRRIEITNYHRLFWHATRAHRTALGLPMTLDIGGISRRQRALDIHAPGATTALAGHKGLLETLAEQAFPHFHDDRTPGPMQLQPLLDAVNAEHLAGRLVFDDLGALFWKLLDSHSTIEAAYKARYPIVIADEHQDASALQDAVVRRLADTLVVLADPLQLIHGYRGASPVRLDAHIADSDSPPFDLRTPHRWHRQPNAGTWLLAVRRRLLGHTTMAARPPAAIVRYTPADRGRNGTLGATRYAVLNAFTSGCRRVAVLARTTDDVAQLRNHLTRNDLHPRHANGADEITAAHTDIDLLPSLTQPRQLAHHALDRIAEHVPGLPAATIKQIRNRLTVDQARLAGCGATARPVLNALAGLYRDGPAGYFNALVTALDELSSAGHHVPASTRTSAYRLTAACSHGSLGTDLTTYSRHILTAGLTATQEHAGLYVMTTHQAKGREFDAVILAHADQRSYPDTADGRHLFYVALTRGRSRWYIVTQEAQRSPLIDHL